MAYRYRVRNPRLQARVFLPDWFVKIVRPGKEIAKDTVQLHVPLDMGKVDIKNYMEKIYNVPVAKVNTRIQAGKIKTTQWRNDVITRKTADIKVAYVILKEGTFEFPDMFPEISPKEVDDDVKKISPNEKSIEDSQKAVATWFQ
ncbi:large ribosomal subunit protein uL23m isoform X1 [Hydra vulgaris]|nr:39S ribosomal protein L23, mitochondrial [Hydra vulgaris]